MDIRLKHDHARLHEETTHRLLWVEQQEICIWDHFVLILLLREYPVSIHERQCKGMRPHSLQCVDGKHCYCDRGGGGRTIEAFDDTFFDWWERHILKIEDYPYVGINFSRDPDMPIPPRAERGEIGTFVFNFLFLYIYIYIYIYIIFMGIRVSDTYVFIYVQMWDQCIQQTY
jgi:hypothetical protein